MLFSPKSANDNDKKGFKQTPINLLNITLDLSGVKIQIKF